MIIHMLIDPVQAHKVLQAQVWPGCEAIDQKRSYDMKKIFMCGFGGVLILASLWLGSYFLFTLPSWHWANFPTYLTACGGVGVGLLLVLFGAMND